MAITCGCGPQKEGSTPSFRLSSRVRTLGSTSDFVVKVSPVQKLCARSRASLLPPFEKGVKMKQWFDTEKNMNIINKGNYPHC